MIVLWTNCSCSQMVVSVVSKPNVRHNTTKQVVHPQDPSCRCCKSAWKAKSVITHTYLIRERVLIIVTVHPAGAAYASQCSWQRSAAHPQQATEPGSGHCLGVLGAVSPPAQGVQGNCRQDQEQGRHDSLQCLEGPSNAAGKSQAAVQTGPWRVSAQLLCCLGVGLLPRMLLLTSTLAAGADACVVGTCLLWCRVSAAAWLALPELACMIEMTGKVGLLIDNMT